MDFGNNGFGRFVHNPVNSNFRVDILFGGTVITRGDLWLVSNEFGSTLALNVTGL
jgi:hypothetical protein